jgi:hypothetical protein
MGQDTNMNFYFITSYLFYPFHYWVFPLPCPPNQVGERKGEGDRGYDNIVGLILIVRMRLCITYGFHDDLPFGRSRWAVIKEGVIALTLFLKCCVFLRFT